MDGLLEKAGEGRCLIVMDELNFSVKAVETGIARTGDIRKGNVGIGAKLKILMVAFTTQSHYTV